MIRDAAVVEALVGDDALLDAILIETNIQCLEGKSFVELRFKARLGSRFSELILKFIEIIEFNILYEDGDIPLDVWDLKFIQLKDGSFYITLDPDPSTLGAAGVKELQPCDTDEFFVRARHVEAVVKEATI